MKITDRLKSYVREWIGAQDFTSSAIPGAPLGITELQAREAYNIASSNAALGNAVGMIANASAAFKFGVQVKEGAEIDYMHPLSVMLKNSGEGYAPGQLIREIITGRLVAEESWIVARGNINRPPLSMTFIRPYDVQIVFNENDGLPDTIITLAKRDRRTYTRREIGGQIRYIDARELNEIIPIIGDLSLRDDWRGRSRISKILYDATMNTSGKRHNVSLLANGMRTSAIISPRSIGDRVVGWTENKVKAIAKAIRENNQGSGVAGNVVIMSEPAQIDGLTQSNKDADFLGLLNVSDVAIYNEYRIPLPLVMKDSMTYNNYTTAKRAFYDEAVLPIFNDVMQGVVAKLAGRYKLPIGAQIAVSVVAIPGMRQVLVEDMKTLKETEVVEVNEIRTVGGFEATEGGDVVLVQGTKLPLTMVSAGDAGGSSDFQQTTPAPKPGDSNLDNQGVE